MSKYRPDEIPPGATKPISQMTADEYKSWAGSRGGSSKSVAKIRAAKRNSRLTRRTRAYSLKQFQRIVHEVKDVLVVMSPGNTISPGAIVDKYSSKAYPIDETRAEKIIAAAHKLADSTLLT
jgi:hypothetical protein